MTDNFGAVQGTVNFGRDGSVACGGPLLERGRPTPMGQWIDVPYSAGNFLANAGSWTVEAGDVAFNRYTLIGTTLIWHLQFGTTSLSAAANYLYVAVPTGAGAIASVAPTRGKATNNGVRSDVESFFASASLLGIALADGTNWAASANNTSLAITAILALA
jgi:hypothetical protein